MTRWVLPEYIDDILPAEAEKIEQLRRRILDVLRSRGYQLVQPPLLEYLDSLLSGSGSDMGLRTFKLVDQLSGETMGVRADFTPQVARMDAHLLNRQGVTRLCYAGSVLHTLPRSLTARREPLQIGAELYGHAGIEADIEIVRLLADILALAGLEASRIDLGHVGIFRALSAGAGLSPDNEKALFAALQNKDIPEVRARAAAMPAPYRAAFSALPECYGGVETLERAAQVLPNEPAITAMLGELRALAEHLHDLPLGFDLADLRGFDYHSGIVLAAYCGGSPSAIALGGRYDEVGAAFGRARAATGFSLSLRDLAERAVDVPAYSAILAPGAAAPGLVEEIARLRAAGEIVMRELPGHAGTWREAGCDRQLILRGDQWLVEPLEGD